MDWIQARAERLRQGGENLLVRKVLGVPGFQRGQGFGQGLADHGVVDRAEHHVGDREDEGDHDEGQQRQDQPHGLELVAALRLGQLGLQRHAVDRGDERLIGRDVCHISSAVRL